MPVRVTPLVSGQFYHIYNRGVAKQQVYFDKRDYEHALLGLAYYRFATPLVRLSKFLQMSSEDRDMLLSLPNEPSKQLVEIVGYCLMSNHFHLLVRQVVDGGTSQFMQRWVISYTKYVNTRHQRVGPLLQGAFKAVRIESDEQLVHVSRYIHLNPVEGYVIHEKDLFSYPWSSLPDYMLDDPRGFVAVNHVLGNFTDKDGYRAFLEDQVDYARSLKEIDLVTFKE